MNTTTNPFDLQGRTCLITGAAGLLGPEHAAALLAMNGRVILTDVNLDLLNKKKEALEREFPGSNSLALKMDVTCRESVSGVLARLLESHGGIHVLLNNAAIDPKVQVGADSLLEQSRFENFAMDQWDFQLNVGLKGAFLCSQIFGSWMAAHGGGVIVNIASDLSVIAPDQRLYRKPGLSSERQPVKPVTYSVIKTGLVGLTRYLAAYWAEQAIRVNALSPGGVFNNQPPEFLEKLSPLIPLGRMADRRDYRGAIQFLCSDASSYMTGQNLVIDGGRSII